MSRKLFNNIFSLRKSRSIGGDGSSRRGRRLASESDRDENSVRDSSTHSALFYLELSTRGPQAAEREAILASLHADELREPSTHMAGTLQRVIYLGRPLMEFELDLMQDIKSTRELCTIATGLVLAKMADELDYMGYTVEVRKNNPTDPGYKHNLDKSCLEKLCHTYIVCHGRKDKSVTHTCIVDPRFREQFQVGHPTPAYTSLLKTVPMEFVGSPLRLQALANLLCEEIANAYRSQELPLPPWRKTNAVLSKWFSPADMAVGAAVAAGLLPLAPGSEDGEEEEQVAVALPSRHTSLRGRAQPPPPEELPQQPEPQLFGTRCPPQLPQSQQQQRRALCLPTGAPTLLATLRAQQQQQQGEQGAVAPASVPASSVALVQQAQAPPGPAAGAPAQGMHFFEALSLHQKSLRHQQLMQQRRQQQQQQQQVPGQQQQQVPGQQQQQQVPGQQQQQQVPRQLGPPGAVQAQEGQQQHSGAAYQSVAAALWAMQPMLSSHAPAPAPAGPLGEHPDARLHDRTNRPRRQVREVGGSGGGSSGMQQQSGAAASLWAPPEEACAQQLVGGGGGGRLGHNAAGLALPAGSWTDLSTILETRSAQSSPQVGSLADGGSQAAVAMATVMASSESSRTAGSSRGPSSAARYPVTPLSAFAGESLGPGAGQGGLAGIGPASFAVPAAEPEAGRKGGKRVVSLLAKGLKSMSQKQTWANLLPNVHTVKRQGNSREGSSRGGDRSWRGILGDWSWRGGAAAGDSSLKGGAYQDVSNEGSGRRGGGRPPAVPRVVGRP